MTQKYNRVAWQDETTSQQGTLINAERLNQMQTAHHYADGFEEVDEVPTEDPGVDYHKVVYCTADTTFYRWNGEEWTKDVDDDTKALLLAHEADHANPHVVTKAQVGLGNCDNTSDLNKPVSTAMQTALDDKVTIIPVTSGVKFYAQSSGGTSLYQGTSSPVTGITSVPMRDSSGRIKTATPSANDDASNKKYVDDADALKLNISDLVSAWQDTPDDDHIPSEKLVKDSLDDKADKATTLAGYGITDAVDTANAQTVGGAKTFTGQLIATGQRAYDPANTNDIATIGTLDTYTPMVRTTGNQTIGGTKTFSSVLQTSDYPMYSIMNSYTNVGTGKWKKLYSWTSGSVANDITVMIHRRAEHITTIFTASGTASDGLICRETLSNALDNYVRLVRQTDGKIVLMCSSPRVTAHVLMSGASNTTALKQVTVEDASVDYDEPAVGDDYTWVKNVITRNDYVDLSSAQTITGAKTFTGQMLATGQRAYDPANTSDVATIGTLDTYTPMVRTSGNQTIAGEKTFTNPVTITPLSIGTCQTINTTGNAETIVINANAYDVTDGVTHYLPTAIAMHDKNGVLLGRFRFISFPNGRVQISVDVRNADGTNKNVVLAEGNS